VDGTARLPGERRGQLPCHGLVGSVRPAVGAALHPLGGIRDRDLLVLVHLDQRVEEAIGGVDRIHEPLDLAPPLRRALLEEPDGVPVTPTGVAQPGLLKRRGVGDDHRRRRQPLPEGHPGDDGAVGGLLDIER
jgi:hypothetical protein